MGVTRLVTSHRLVLTPDWSVWGGKEGPTDQQTDRPTDKASCRPTPWVWQKKYNLFSWENLIKYKNLCLVFKMIHGLAPPPLSGFIELKSASSRVTRGAARGDCTVPFRVSAFSQAVFSFKASHQWNSVPQSIRESPTYYSLLESLLLTTVY